MDRQGKIGLSFYRAFYKEEDFYGYTPTPKNTEIDAFKFLVADPVSANNMERLDSLAKKPTRS